MGWAIAPSLFFLNHLNLYQQLYASSVRTNEKGRERSTIIKDEGGKGKGKGRHPPRIINRSPSSPQKDGLIRVPVFLGRIPLCPSFASRASFAAAQGGQSRAKSKEQKAIV